MQALKLFSEENFGFQCFDTFLERILLPIRITTKFWFEESFGGGGNQFKLIMPNEKVLHKTTLTSIFSERIRDRHVSGKGKEISAEEKHFEFKENSNFQGFMKWRNI